MAEGINLRSGKIDLPPYPFVRYYFDWGVGSPRLTYVWPLIVFTASTSGAFVMRGIQKIVLYLIVLRIPEKLCGFGYQSRNSVDGLFNDKCKTLTSSMVDGCINVATIQNWEYTFDALIGLTLAPQLIRNALASSHLASPLSP